jgi:hypothetical protein
MAPSVPGCNSAAYSPSIRPQTSLSTKPSFTYSPLGAEEKAGGMIS